MIVEQANVEKIREVSIRFNTKSVVMKTELREKGKISETVLLYFENSGKNSITSVPPNTVEQKL